MDQRQGGKMMLKQIRGQDTLPEFARRRLEETVYTNGELARKDVHEFFPNHVVSEQSGCLRVAVKDNSFTIAEFQEIG
jgi:hypothetical protein